MRALVLEKYKKLVLTNVREPDVGPGDVLIEVAACGICGSDVHGMDGSTGRRIPPVIMGHEATGVVVECGANATRFKQGDRVTFDSTVYCGECANCRKGAINLCDNRWVLGVSCEEYRSDGAFAEFIAVPERVVYKLPDDLAFEHAAMVEPLSVAAHAVRRTPVRLADTALVVGAGVIGLLLVQVLRASGCGRIIAVDLDESRLDVARKVGADDGLVADECDVRAEVLERTNGRGADLAFEAVGVDAAVRTAIASVRKGGAVGLVGNVSPRAELPLQAVVTREVSLHGSCASSGEYPACLAMLARGTVDVTPLISAVAPMREGPSWFKRLCGGERGLLKVILKP